MEKVAVAKAVQSLFFLGKRFFYFREWLLRNPDVRYAVFVDAFDTQVSLALLFLPL